MGAVFVRKGIYDAFMEGPEEAIELFHGYTYAAHPLACAASHASLDTYVEEGLFERASGEIGKHFENAIHGLKGEPHVIDLRNLGLVGAVELESIPGKPSKRAFAVFLKCYDKGVLVRTTGHMVAHSPPLPVEPAEIHRNTDPITN